MPRRFRGIPQGRRREWTRPTNTAPRKEQTTMATASSRLANHHRGLNRPASPPAPARVVTDGEKIARGVGAVGLAGVGLIHLLDVVDKFHETAYIGGAHPGPLPRPPAAPRPPPPWAG